MLWAVKHVGPKTWDLCDRYVKKCTENRGVKRGRSVDCTIRTGCIARTEAGVVGPQGQACRKISKKHWSRGKKACCPQSQDVDRYRRTIGVGTTKKGEEKRVKRNRPVGNLERGSTTGGLWGHVQPNMKKGVQKKNRRMAGEPAQNR